MQIWFHFIYLNWNKKNQPCCVFMSTSKKGCLDSDSGNILYLAFPCLRDKKPTKSKRYPSSYPMLPLLFHDILRVLQHFLLPKIKEIWRICIEFKCFFAVIPRRGWGREKERLTHHKTVKCLHKAQLRCTKFQMQTLWSKNENTPTSFLKTVWGRWKRIESFHPILH